MLLYIHIPFCDSKCHYCAFNSYVDKFHLKDAYMKTLLVQLKHDFKIHKVEQIETVFIGGGTPSSVEASLYEDIFNFIKPYLVKNAEFTSEANPNSATLPWLEKMYSIGLNRLSLGVQSFDEQKLKFLGRRHSAKSAISAVENAKKVGFENISIDLIYGTKLDTQKLLAEDLKTAFSLPINHLSAYSLTIEEETKFENKFEYAKENLELIDLFFSSVKEHGFAQYEISNFGTYQSKHNLGYWQGKEYLGIGSGAVGFVNNQRYYPSKNVEDYIQNPLKYDVENLSQKDLHVEKIFLGLRSIVGIDSAILDTKEKEKFELLLNEKKVTKKDERYYNTNFLLADEIALFVLD